MRDQQPDTVREFHDFAFALNVEIDFVVACGGMIDGFFQADQRFNHLLREG